MNKYLNKFTSYFRKSNVDASITHQEFDWQHAENEEWIDDSSEFYRILQEAYFEFRYFDGNAPRGTQFFYNGKSSGFAVTKIGLSYDSSYYLSLIKHMILFLKSIGYIVHLSELRLDPQKEEKKYHVYTKPSRKLVDETGVFDQLYGNISLEYIEKSKTPFQLKCMANIYSDQNFKEALDFEKLLKDLIIR